MRISLNSALRNEGSRHTDLFSFVVIAELYNHSKKESPKFDNPEADSARKALDSIRAALDERKDIKILTPEGNDVTQKMLSVDNTAFSEEDRQRDAEEIVIGVARRASDLSSSQRAAQPNGTAKPAILITEQKSTRLKANYQDIAAMSTSRVRTILQAILRRRRSSSSASSICHSGGIATPTEIAG